MKTRKSKNEKKWKWEETKTRRNKNKKEWKHKEVKGYPEGYP